MTTENGQPKVMTFGSRPLPKEKWNPEPTRQRGLGRGLDALIPADDGDKPGSGLVQAPIGSITPNPSQPRQQFDEQQLEELASSIMEHGILQPLLVRALEAGRYELIAGERRWRAAALAGLKTAPIVIQEKGAESSEERLTLALVENLQREDLNPIEAASAFEQLAEVGWTQERIAAEVGKSRAAVANLMRLRGLPQAIQQTIAFGVLSEGHGRALLGAPRAEQSALAHRSIEAGWSVRQLEAAVKALTDTEPPPARQTVEASPAMTAAVEQLESALGTRVEVRTGAKGPSRGGRIVIHWYDEEQLTSLASQMSGLVVETGEAEAEFGV